MSKIILITGGNRSGKSTYAEQLLVQEDDVLYLATAVRTDSEMERRIQHHRASRNPRWVTHEGYRDLDQVLATHAQPSILLDCVTNMVSNLIFYGSGNVDELAEGEKEALFRRIQAEFRSLLRKARQTERRLILVSNEVGMGLISEYPLGRLFVDFAGFINQELAREADQVVFMVAGLPLTLKG